MKIYKLDFLLKILDIDIEELTHILAEKEDAYYIFEIPKKNGIRQIHGLNEDKGKKLKKLQQKFYRNVLCKQPVALPAKGFLKGESYLSFLEPHVGNRFFLRLDIHDFFESFSEQMIRENLERFIEDKEALEFAFEICTVEKRITQGAVTSPALSNIMFTRLDQRILKYCQSLEETQRRQLCMKRSGWWNASMRYTRYADDMLFSSDFFDFRNNLSFLHMISHIVGEYGFRLNRQKTIMMENEISMNGYVVGENIRLSRKKTSDLRKILYCFKDEGRTEYRIDREIVTDHEKVLGKLNRIFSDKKEQKKDFSNIYELIWYLGGCRSWIISILQSEEKNGQKVKNMKKLVRRIEDVLDALQEAEEKSS